MNTKISIFCAISRGGVATSSTSVTIQNCTVQWSRELETALGFKSWNSNSWDSDSHNIDFVLLHMQESASLTLSFPHDHIKFTICSKLHKVRKNEGRGDKKGALNTTRLATSRKINPAPMSHKLIKRVAFQTLCLDSMAVYGRIHPCDLLPR